MDEQPTRSSDAASVAPFLVFFGSLAVILLVMFAPLAGQHRITITPTPTLAPTPTTAPMRVSALFPDPAMAAAGERIFQGTCAMCHGFNAMGISGLGKPLIGSQFVNSRTDDQMVEFLTHGRQVTDPLNTTGVMMPARGGNPTLTDDNLREVVAYIRSLNAPQVASAVTMAGMEAMPTAAPTLALAANPTPTPIGTPQVEHGALNLSSMSGQAAYEWSCAGCHGLDGRGVPFIGTNLLESDLVRAADGIAIYNFLVNGKPPADPRVEYPHPARGGYPQLSDEQLRSIVAYLSQLKPLN